MAITLTTVTRIGTPPTTQLLIKGTVDSCETLYVTSSCTKPLPGGNGYQATITGLGGLPPQEWSATLPNDLDCGCGTPVKVSASCQLGMPSGATVNFPPITILCDTCPTLTITADPPGPCVNGKRSVIFHASINGVPTTGTVLQWTFPNGVPTSPTATTAFVVMSNGTLPNQIVEYAANTSGPVTRTASLQIILPANCPPPPAPPASVTVTIDSCPSCCPSMTLLQPTVTGCAPGTAVASFAAVLTWPTSCTPVTPSSYEWTLNGPGGKKYQRSTSQPNADTSTPWTDVASGNPAVVQFTAGGNYSASVTATIPGVSLPCNPTDTAAFTVSACCPQLISPLNASEQPGDPCTWLFSTQVSNPNNAAVTFEWSFHDGTTATTSLPQVTHTYKAGSMNTTGMTTVTLKSPDCPDTSLSATVTQRCVCPTVGTPNAVVTGCVPGPGTAPGTPPAVVLSTSVSPPVATSFDWTVTTPGLTSFTKTTTAASTTDGISDGVWTNIGTGSTGPLNLAAPGSYAVTVKAKGPALSPTCPSTPPGGFTIPICPCPPGMARDASGVCVPVPTPPPPCSIWCILAGIFFIAIPISAYISTAAHCLLGPIWNIALQGGIIATAIGIFIALCGICCLWIYLLIGSALGVVATLIAAYWLGFPACWFDALPIFIGFIALGIGMSTRCPRL